MIDNTFYQQYYHKNNIATEQFCNTEGYVSHPSVITDFFNIREYTEFYKIKYQFLSKDPYSDGDLPDSIEHYMHNKYNIFFEQHKSLLFNNRCDISTNQQVLIFVVCQNVSSKDLELLSNLSQCFKKIFILDYTGSIRLPDMEIYDNINAILDKLDNYPGNYAIVMKNTIHIDHLNLSLILNIILNSNGDLVSLTNGYNNSGYTLSDELFCIKVKYKYIIKDFNLADNNSNLLASRSIKESLIIGAFLSCRIFSSLFYGHKTLNLLNYPYLLKQYGINIIKQSHYINKSKVKPKILLYIHIGKNNEYMLSEFHAHINHFQLMARNYETDVVITSNEKLIGTKYRNIVVPNKGMDIGAFIRIVNSKEYQKYNYIVKLHSKTLHAYRQYSIGALLNNLIQNIENIENKDLFCLCPEKNIQKLENTLNQRYIRGFCNKYNIDHTKTHKFCSGSFFIINNHYLLNFIDNYKINISNQYNLLENNYTNNYQDTVVHAWERIITGIVSTAIHKPIAPC